MRVILKHWKEVLPLDVEFGQIAVASAVYSSAFYLKSDLIILIALFEANVSEEMYEVWGTHQSDT